MSSLESMPKKDAGTPARTAEVNKPLLSDPEGLKQISQVLEKLAAKKDDLLMCMGLHQFEISDKSADNSKSAHTGSTTVSDTANKPPDKKADHHKTPSTEAMHTRPPNPVEQKNDVPPSTAEPAKPADKQPSDQAPPKILLKDLDEALLDSQRQPDKQKNGFTKTNVEVTRHMNKLPGGGELDRQDSYDHLKLPNGDTIHLYSEKDEKGKPSYSYVIKERGKPSDITRHAGSKDQFVVTMPDGTKIGVKGGRVVAIRKDNKQLNLKEQDSLD